MSKSYQVKEACSYNSRISKKASSASCRIAGEGPTIWSLYAHVLLHSHLPAPGAPQFGSSTRWNIHPRIDDFYIWFDAVLAKIWLYNLGNPTHIVGGAQARAN